MEISITNVENTSKQTFIHFNSILGNGSGLWMSRKKPSISSEYHVEFNIEENLIWSNNIVKADSEISFIKINKEKIEIQGEIEKIEDFEDAEDIENKGNTCFMRLDNSLFIFSCVNIPLDFTGYAKITAKNLEIYDMNY